MRFYVFVASGDPAWEAAARRGASRAKRILRRLRRRYAECIIDEICGDFSEFDPKVLDELDEHFGAIALLMDDFNLQVYRTQAGHVDIAGFCISCK